MADTSSGDTAKAYRGQLFFLRENPHSKLFGELYQNLLVNPVTNLAEKYCPLRNLAGNISGACWEQEPLFGNSIAEPCWEHLRLGNLLWLAGFSAITKAKDPKLSAVRESMENCMQPRTRMLKRLSNKCGALGSHKAR